jgi:hypothetical protein
VRVASDGDAAAGRGGVWHEIKRLSGQAGDEWWLGFVQIVFAPGGRK